MPRYFQNVLLFCVWGTLTVGVVSAHSQTTNQIQAESYGTASNVSTETCSDTGGGLDVDRIQNGSWCEYSNVNFGTNSVSFIARIASASSGGSVQVRSGSTTGALLATLIVPGTGGWQTWQTVSTNINVGGVTNVYLVFAGGSGYLFNLNWFEYIVGGTVAAPSQPGGLTATSSNAAVTLNWSSSSGATSYNIKRSTTAGSGYNTIATNNGVSNTMYVDATVVNGTTYFYVVSALNAGGESTNSSAASATPLAPPGAPTGIAAMVVGNGIEITWNAASNASGYNVKRWISGSATNVLQSNMVFTNYWDFAVGAGTNYNYCISAEDVGGESSNSSNVNATMLTMSTPFVHPGILRTQPELDLIKSNILSGLDPWKTALQQVYAEGYSSGTTGVYTPVLGVTGVTNDPASGSYGNLTAYRENSHAAYVQAMLWAVTGNTQNRDNAIAILNAWSGLQTMAGGDITLDIGDSEFPLACDILAYAKYNGVGSGWTGKAQWQSILANLFRPWLLDYAGANWGTGCMRGRMAIDVFLDDQIDFNNVVTAYKYPYFATQAGLFDQWGWSCQHFDSCLEIGGQDVETVRDQAHTMKELKELEQVCEMAWNQGTDLYSYMGYGLLNGYEYTSSLNLSNTVPFSPYYTYNRGASGNTSPGLGSEGFSQGAWNGQNTYEMVLNHFIIRKGLAAPYTELTAHMLRPDVEDTLYFYSGAPDPSNLGTPAAVNLKSQGGTDGCAVPKGQIEVAWTPTANATGYNIKRSLTSGGPYSTVATNVPWNYEWYDTDPALVGGNTYYYVVSATNASGESANSPESHITLEEALPSPWGSQDIGVTSSSTFSVYNPVPTTCTVCTNGSAYWAANGVNGVYTYDANVYTIAGTGGDIWNTGDIFRYAYQTMSGNGTIIARVVGREGIQDWCKSGLMMRQNLTAGSANVLMCLTANDGAQFQSRSTAGGASTTQLNNAAYLGPFWLKLNRSGNTFTGYISNDGQNWTTFSSATVTMTDPIYVGLASSSYSATQISYASFDNVITPNSTVPPAPTALNGLGGNTQVILNWAAPFGATGYNVKRSTVSGGPYVVVATNLPALSFTNSGLLNGVVYYYLVSGLNGVGEGANSSPIAVRPISSAPVQMTSQVAGGQIQIQWPVDHTGWQLQGQTNAPGMGLGSNWFFLSGSDMTNQILISINPSAGSTFYRLVHP